VDASEAALDGLTYSSQVVRSGDEAALGMYGNVGIAEQGVRESLLAVLEQ
jgi:hypothetical protein